MRQRSSTLKPQVLAFYLPQYHRIPENDAWWGEGFTEWTNVRAARPLFEGHVQPLIPASTLGYYDLSDPNVLRNQAAIAHEYGIHGFCFYNYWFSGKTLLEKPLEMLLTNPDIDLPFCLCWANEPWSRNWNGSNRELLIDQQYGDETVWQAHFEYLSRFFADPRALRLDGFPLVLIYRVGHIPRFNEMIACWRKKAQAAGLEEIRVLSVLNYHPDSYKVQGMDLDGVVEFDPFFTLHNSSVHNAVRREGANTIISYPALQLNGSRRTQIHARQFPGACPCWDNTPRHLQGGATVFTGMTVENFHDHLLSQLGRLTQSVPYVFINAWNEWGEGYVLEPDSVQGMARLQAVRDALDVRKNI